MQLLVYARNHSPTDGEGESETNGGGDAQGEADLAAKTKTFVGLAIGENPRVELGGDFGGGPGPSSFVEVRVPAHTIDLFTAVPLLVAKAIAREPRANRRTIALSCAEGVVRLKLEPGFADAKQVCAPLMPLLERCRVFGDTLTNSITNAVTEAPGRGARPTAPPTAPRQDRHV
ncbi:MAG: hypothetical protein AAF721_05595 [Myxococcota bacterium]